MSDLPLVSVIMPTYNRAHLIAESLECVLHQTYSHWECIIVDDGSTDASQEVVALYLKKDNRFTYFKKLNAGAATARNYAVSKSKGVYILPLDSDDLIGLDYIEKAVGIFNKHPEYTLVYGQGEKNGVETGYWNLPPYQFDKFLIYNMIYNSSMFKRSDFDRVGGYQEGCLFEDWDFWIKLLKPNGKVYQIPEVMYFYRTHLQDSITRLLDHQPKLYKSSMDMLFKNHIEVYLQHIGNPILIERERRQLASIARTANYKLAMRLIKMPLFKWFRTLGGKLKQL